MKTDLSVIGSIIFLNLWIWEDIPMTAVQDILRSLGITRCYKGFKHTEYAICLAIQDESRLEAITKEIYMEPYKYFNNFIEMPVVLIVFLVGVVLVLFGIGKTLLKKTFDKGIWFVGIGTVLTVLALLLTAGYNNTAYYPSNTDIQSSLTLANSCSSQFTLKTMAYVSILVPFVIAYIFYAWRSIDNRKIDAKEMDEGGHAY